MSTNTPGLLSIKQPVPKKTTPEQESVRPLARFFIANINFYSYTRAKWYDNISADYKPHTHKIIERLREADRSMQSDIVTGECLENWDKFMECRQTIKMLSENCIRKEMKLCRKENVEQHLWKILYYNLIEFFKVLIAESKLEERTTYFQTKLKAIIDDGLTFYCHMLDVLQTTYNFQLTDLLETDVDPRVKFKDNKFVQLAMVSAQKYFLFLGDLSRYKETNKANGNLASAKEYYLKAQRLIPSNGVPYNQLAFVALHSKNKFAAVYYYIRSLKASNPIQTAKENLKVLFDEARKSYEANRKTAMEHKSPVKTVKEDSKKSKTDDENSRQEIWIHPISGKSMNRRTMQLIEDDDTDGTDGEFDDFNGKEIAKRFMTSFVNVHGKLITKIGMDSFMTCAKQMLKEFQRLLNCNPIPLNFRCFLQILCINVYTISEARKKTATQTSNTRSDILDASLSISFCMFELMCRKFVELSDFASLQPYSDLQLSIPEDAEIILPSIKTWTDWMASNDELWIPLQSLAQYNVGGADVPLYSFRKLMSSLNGIGDLLSEFSLSHTNGNASMITLPEDVMLEGFPLIASAVKPIFCLKAEKKKSISLSRLQVILDNGNKIFTAYNPSKQEAVNVAPQSTVNTKIYDSSTEEEEILDDQLADLSDNNSNNSPDNLSEIQNLIRRKMELEKRHKLQTRKDQRVQEIMEQTQVSQCIEVRPKYLIPDTNCFIDFLDHLKELAATKNFYYLLVPTFVINEIEGLSKGTPPSEVMNNQVDVPPSKREYERWEMVGKAAKESLNFLKNRPPNIKCVTSKGSIMNTFSFTFEEVSAERGCNDDRILSSAVNLCKKSALKTKNNVQHLLREVVLLTTDRNLCVKALAQNIPVRQVPDFMEWDVTFGS
ncbi:telomerase-binding protein EST1A isoform X2 [Bradysia coprophila]|uniref:telomerase-binding protein EST1A isoform X2 n=1 Tax=Bradysia coprophila TaxID=38358 RepID=UPI00187DC63B|nr:telomerase-binding protein EST1A isoform X2 [Bradysia coprophila]